jgi:hypothetical protein
MPTTQQQPPDPRFLLPIGQSTLCVGSAEFSALIQEGAEVLRAIAAAIEQRYEEMADGINEKIIAAHTGHRRGGSN